MNCLQPYVHKKTGEVVFVEKTKGDSAICICCKGRPKMGEEDIGVYRTLFPIKDLNSILSDHREFVMINHDLYFKVTDITRSSEALGGANSYEPILNSVLKLRLITKDDNGTILYQLVSKGKSFMFFPEEIRYLPLVEMSGNNNSHMMAGMNVVAKVNYPCHGINRGDTFVIAGMEEEDQIYLINTKTGERKTSYPRLFKVYCE